MISAAIITSATATSTIAVAELPVAPALAPALASAHSILWNCYYTYCTLCLLVKSIGSADAACLELSFLLLLSTLGANQQSMLVTVVVTLVDCNGIVPTAT